jgi:hypothetical protein
MTNVLEFSEDWVILELMGHRVRGGFLTVQEIAGFKFLRLDIPLGATEEGTVEFYPPAAVYCINVATKERVDAWAEEQQRYRRPYHFAELTDGDGSDDDGDDDDANTDHADYPYTKSDLLYDANRERELP